PDPVSKFVPICLRTPLYQYKRTFTEMMQEADRMYSGMSSTFPGRDQMLEAATRSLRARITDAYRRVEEDCGQRLALEATLALDHAEMEAIVAQLAEKSTEVTTLERALEDCVNEHRRYRQEVKTRLAEEEDARLRSGSALAAHTQLVLDLRFELEEAQRRLKEERDNWRAQATEQIAKAEKR
ncbi:unnamed protein product, partial [Sphacelaria rigidula]